MNFVQLRVYEGLFQSVLTLVFHQNMVQFLKELDLLIKNI